MKLGDRVKIVNYCGMNCGDIPFQGLTGAIIAKIHSTQGQGNILMYLVLFDYNICGLTGKSCSHIFADHSQSEGYTFLEGGIALGQRNQRFFQEQYLKLTAACAAGLTEPKNNDGKTSCLWCGAPTKRVLGFSTNSYDICTRCGK